jgi:hypothetical protein
MLLLCWLHYIGHITLVGVPRTGPLQIVHGQGTRNEDISVVSELREGYLVAWIMTFSRNLVTRDINGCGLRQRD